MTHTELYRFSSRAYGATIAASPDIFEKALEDGRNDFDCNCHKFLLVGDYDYYRYPIVFRQYDGHRLRDFLDTGFPPVYLISDRVVTLLKDNKITGWDNYPIVLYDKKGKAIDGYSGFSIIGKGGIFSKYWEYGYNSQTKESFVDKRGIYKISQWDGSDIFMISRDIIITDRVMKLFSSNKVTAVDYEKLSDIVDII